MAQVVVTINGRSYRIACEDGQEEHLKHLSGYVSEKVKELVSAVGQIGDTRLLVMASLLIADELSDARSDVVETRQELDRIQSEAEDVLAGRLDNLASRIDHIAIGVGDA